MRIFESDGSESDMCGNGLRCISKLLEPEFGREINIETNSGIFHTSVNKDSISVIFQGIQNPLRYISKKAVPSCIVFEYKNKVIYLLNSGEPHAVIMAEDVNSVDLNELLDLARDINKFPDGINLNVMQIIDDKTIKIRTLERGLWKTTACCGTGSVACATLSRLLGLCKSKNIKVINDGGSLKIIFFRDKILMRGPASHIATVNYTGEADG